MTLKLRGWVPYGPNFSNCLNADGCILVIGLMKHLLFILKQGIDGSARKPAHRQDTGYMVEKTYHDMTPYLRAFGAYLMPQ